jgi:pyruvate/2-oxoglutarate dehydrogenase complex dihydrolipoamide dehydrogenase (E3) component
MYELGTNFAIGKTPVELTKDASGVITVNFDDGSYDEFDTVLIATGRTPATRGLNLPKSAEIHSSGKLVADPLSNLVRGTKSIYAVGDCLVGSPELTPVAVKDGELLARRLFKGDSKAVFDKRFVPTTVFTPSEYGSVGLSEEEAVKQYGAANIDSYLYEWPSLERAALHREKPSDRRIDEGDVEQGNNCFTKLVVHKAGGLEKVVGFHFIGANAGEVTQGFALAVKLGATKQDFDDLVGIHPTDAEALCGLSVTRSSGEDFVAAGGCGGGKCG